MAKYSNKTVPDTIRKNAILGIFVISILGVLLHFLYDFSGESPIIGIIAPVNESVWEHLKLAFFPTIIWWAFSYVILNKKNKVCFIRWFFSCVVALIINPLFITAFYYTYTGALGIHSLILDVASLFLGTAIAQLTALIIYRNAKPKRCHLYLAILIFIAMLIAFIVFTFNPPRIPLFRDPSTGKYGI